MTYATSLTGWHGHKALGFLITCDAINSRVTLSAPDALEQVARKLLTGQITITPKHIMTSDFDEIAEGIIPSEGDPSRESVMSVMSTCRECLGGGIWLSIAYPKLVMPINVLCKRMAYPHPELTLKALRYIFMHLRHNPEPASWGGWGVVGLEQTNALITPYSPGVKAMYFHYFSDANLKERSTSGGLGMLGGGPICILSQRQQLASPDSHTSEVVSAGVNLSTVIPINGTLQELRIRCGAATPFYLDSKTTVFVATNDTAVKKSVWLVRRVVVIADGVKQGEIQPIHINDPDMCADPLTKYLTFPVWDRHMAYMLNRLP